MSLFGLLVAQALAAASTGEAAVIVPKTGGRRIPPPMVASRVEEAPTLEWTCDLKSPVHDEFVISGRFGKPVFEVSGVYVEGRVIRPVSFRAHDGFDLEASGEARWLHNDGSKLGDRYYFTIEIEEQAYQVEMEFIRPGEAGWVVMYSSPIAIDRNPILRPPDPIKVYRDRALMGIGMCQTTIAPEEEASQ